MSQVMTHARLIALLKQKGIQQTEVLNALQQIDRADFVDAIDRSQAYEDRPLSIACQQTISQPYIVARMTELMLNGRQQLNKVLEIGTGSGYQAAILSCVAMHVYSIERIEALYQAAKVTLAAYKNIHTFLNDDIDALMHDGPFDGIIVTACCHKIAPHWLNALADGGCLVLPLAQGEGQYLTQVVRDGKAFTRQQWDAVSFVPLLKGIF